MKVWEAKIEFERNGKLTYVYHRVNANDIYSALTEITYYIDHDTTGCAVVGLKVKGD